MSLVDLIKQESVMLLHKSRRTGCLLCKKKEMYTYSEDFFMIAFFTLRARGVSTTVLIASGGVTPAGGAVPATAMVTAPIAEADGSVPSSSRSGLGGEAGALQMDNVSVQQYQYLTIQQGSKFIPGRLDYVRFPFSICTPLDDPAGPKAEFRSTPWMVRGSCYFSSLLQLPLPPGGSHL
jgi:hypothetical protein